MKRLVLLRHAHRDTSQGRELDNGLSEKGLKQTELITRRLFKKLDSDNIQLLTSPSTRCIQTLEPLSKKLKLELLTLESLFEQRDSESSNEFRDRVRKTLQQAKDFDRDWVVLCSHGDWIPLALQFLTGHPIGLQKGRWADVRFKKDQVVRYCVQCELA